MPKSHTFSIGTSANGQIISTFDIQIKIDMRNIVTIVLIFGVATLGFSQLQTSTSKNATGVIGENGGGAAIVLTIDQTPGAGGNSVACQEFPDFGDARLQAADDFIIPAGPDLIIDNVDIIGVGFNGGLGVNCGGATVSLEVYANAGGSPGALLFSESFDGATVDPDNDGSFNLPSTTCPPLPPGTYWLSVVPTMPFGGCGQWGWTGSTDNLAPAGYQFQDPGGLTGNPCVSWGDGGTTCGIVLAGDGLAFRMELAASAVVPTMGEWAVICLGLILAIFGITAVVQRQTSIA